MLAQVQNLEWTLVPDRRRRAAALGTPQYPDPELAEETSQFHLPHAATAIRVIRTHTVKGKTDRETVYFATAHRPRLHTNRPTPRDREVSDSVGRIRADGQARRCRERR